MKIAAEVLFACFLISYILDKRRVLNGKLFTASMYCFIMHCILLLQDNPNDFISQIGFILLSILFALIPILYFSVGIALIINSFMMFKYEGKRYINFLSMLVGLFLFIIFILIIAAPLLIKMPSWLVLAYQGGLLLIGYYTFIFVSFMISSLLFNMNRPRLNQDFIIILGSGLVNDKVTPLLKARIETGYNFYIRQKRKTDNICTFIVSGGQGEDEKMAEAVAMKMALIEKGVPNDHILVEDHSRTTYENMLFSKEIMDKIKSDYHVVFATNNYHLFRSGIYAKKAGLKKAEGIGAPTASYYLPSAFLREFIAYLMMNAQVNAVIILTTVLVTLLAAIVSVFI